MPFHGRPSRPSNPREKQERAVISTYQAKVRSHSDALEALWRRFDAEPDDARLTVQIRQHHMDAQHALEAYFAALGSRSMYDLPGITAILQTTDDRLDQLDRQMICEVDRLETTAADIASKFASVSAPDLRAHISADADDALIELELYEHGWGAIMDKETRSRLQGASDILRDVLQNAPKRQASPLPDDFQLEYSRTPKKHYHILQKDADAGVPHGVNYNPTTVLYDEDIIHNSCLALSPSTHAHSPSTSSMEKSLSQHAPPPPPPPRVLSANLRKVEQASSSESGDDAPLLMVMSRTRTLRDMAETAMSGPDELGVLASQSSSPRRGASLERCRPANGLDGGINTSTSVSASVSVSGAGSTASATASTEKAGMPSGVEGEQPSNPIVSKNMSFASTLYHTSNARVEAISDAGVTLQRSTVRGDGRCLFRAIARCRNVARANFIPNEREEREEADQLRLRAVAELKKHRDLLARFFVIEGNFTQYTKKMSQPRTYGGEPELLVLAKLLHIPIAVYITKGERYRQIQVYGKQYRGDPLRILYSDGVHYDALLPCSPPCS